MEIIFDRLKEQNPIGCLGSFTLKTGTYVKGDILAYNEEGVLIDSNNSESFIAYNQISNFRFIK